VGSADSVVLPVPESPKKIATSPFSPTLAEQCMGNTPSSGRRSFIRLKIDFLISPAYEVPPISTSFRVGWSSTNVPVRVPSTTGSASTSGACSTRACDAKCASSWSVGSMNIVRANSAWYGCVVTTRTAMRCSGSAPANASTTYSVGSCER
jgi:hypothetical protein